MKHIPEFENKDQLFAYLRANKKILKAAKMAEYKKADAVVFGTFNTSNDGSIVKATANPELLKLGEFPVKIVINTTNIRDSHKDVHIPGLWDKSLKELKIVYHLQEHELKFENVISDRVTAYTKQTTWRELGESYTGSTQALMFDSIIEIERNEYMAEQYAKGWVRNHSVGMRYVKIDMAINSEYKGDAEEKAVWDKYIGQIANRAEVEEDGYFWAVTEAKLIEGSAVLMGSNCVTPTQSIGEDEDKSLQSADTVTDKEPIQLIAALDKLNKLLTQNN